MLHNSYTIYDLVGIYMCIKPISPSNELKRGEIVCCKTLINSLSDILILFDKVT